jgi:hypothetical protein
MFRIQESACTFSDLPTGGIAVKKTATSLVKAECALRFAETNSVNPSGAILSNGLLAGSIDLLMVQRVLWNWWYVQRDK